jgi:hypothetical protein
VGLERGPPSLVSTVEELLGRKNSGSGLETENMADKRQPRGRYSSLAEFSFSLHCFYRFCSFEVIEQIV